MQRRGFLIPFLAVGAACAESSDLSSPEVSAARAHRAEPFVPRGDRRSSVTVRLGSVDKRWDSARQPRRSPVLFHQVLSRIRLEEVLE